MEQPRPDFSPARVWLETFDGGKVIAKPSSGAGGENADDDMFALMDLKDDELDVVLGTEGLNN